MFSFVFFGSQAEFVGAVSYILGNFQHLEHHVNLDHSCLTRGRQTRRITRLYEFPFYLFLRGQTGRFRPPVKQQMPGAGGTEGQLCLSACDDYKVVAASRESVMPF